MAEERPLNIFQWNVLTQAFCNHNSYPEEDYPAEALDEDRRRGLVLSRILQAMNERRLIVLHEVDIKLRGKLEVEAYLRGYGMACDGHGWWRNWHMGSAVMWPRQDQTNAIHPGFDLQCIEYLVPGERIKANVKDPSPPPPSGVSGWMWWAFTPVTSGYRWARGIKTEMTQGDCYREAVKRSNKLIHVTLGDCSDEGRDVHVWAYHMPCAFRNPPIMQYHANELVRTVHDASNGTHLLCMDGNFQPGTELYNTFTEAGFTSASYAAEGREPGWTCHSKSEWGGVFTGTLDYVWVLDSDSNARRRYSVKWAEVDHPADEAVPFLPCASFPSDHLWMNVSIARERD